MRILVTGAGGQLGSELQRYSFSENVELKAATRAQLDICNKVISYEYVRTFKPKYIVNCAAFTNLDQAELSTSNNFPVNFVGVENLTEICTQLKIGLIQISTDAVFASSKLRVFKKEDELCPINQYGSAKAAAEALLRSSDLNSWIVRTSWLFGEFGGNFFHKILESARMGNSIQVVIEQHGQPTWTKDVANAISLILDGVIKPGTYHAAGLEVRSRYEFAQDIYRLSGTNQNLVESKEGHESYGVASRPKFSILGADLELLKAGWIPASVDQAITLSMSKTK
jgi:dTDP-4-dehydrorhamnose reductase